MKPAGYDSPIEEIDFVAEHPKKDMLKVSRIVVNGKVYLAADKVIEIIDRSRNRCRKEFTRPDEKLYLSAIEGYAAAVRQDISDLKGGEQK